MWKPSKHKNVKTIKTLKISNGQKLKSWKQSKCKNLNVQNTKILKVNLQKKFKQSKCQNVKVVKRVKAVDPPQMCEF